MFPDYNSTFYEYEFQKLLLSDADIYYKFILLHPTFCYRRPSIFITTVSSFV